MLAKTSVSLFNDLVCFSNLYNLTIDHNFSAWTRNDSLKVNTAEITAGTRQNMRAKMDGTRLRGELPNKQPVVHPLTRTLSCHLSV